MSRRGYYGGWGGAYIPEVLYETFRELNEWFTEAKADPSVWKEYEELMSTYSCRPTPLTAADGFSLGRSTRKRSATPR